jgi:hypothetical protein
MPFFKVNAMEILRGGTGNGALIVSISLGRAGEENWRRIDIESM